MNLCSSLQGHSEREQEVFTWRNDQAAPRILQVSSDGGSHANVYTPVSNVSPVQGGQSTVTKSGYQVIEHSVIPRGRSAFDSTRLLIIAAWCGGVAEEADLGCL